METRIQKETKIGSHSLDFHGIRVKARLFLAGHLLKTLQQNTMKKTAYTEWLNQCAEKFAPPLRQETIAYLIHQEMAEQSEKAFDLFESVGHTLVNLANLMDTAKQVIELKNILHGTI